MARAVLLAGSFTWLGLMLSARFPEPASATDLNPLHLAGKVAGKIFGAIGGAAGGFVLDQFVNLLNWLFGTLVNTVTVPLIKFLTSVDLTFGGPLERVAAPIVVIGGFFLLLGTLATVMVGMGSVAAGMDTPGRAIGSALFKLGGLALLMGAWYSIVPLAVDLANGMRDYVLTDSAVKDALTQTFVGAATGSSAGAAIGSAVAPIVLIIVLILVAFTLVVLLLLKYVLIFTFALLYVGGPAAIGAGAFPGVGSVVLNALVRLLLVCMCIPLAWCTVFVAWAGVSAGLAQLPTSTGDAALKVINGPGIFCAAMLVILGVSRALLKMASPVGAPLNVPGARMLMAMAAYKLGGPALAKLGAGSAAASAADTGADAWSRAAVAEHNLNYDQEDIPPPNPEAAQASESVAAAAADAPTRASAPAGASASPDSIADVREQVAARTQTTGRSDASDREVQDAMAGLSDSERANVEQMAEQSFGHAEPDSHFRESVIASAARNEFTNPDQVAVLATASPNQVLALANIERPPATESSQTAVPERPRPYQPDELVGGGGASPPVPPLPPDQPRQQAPPPPPDPPRQEGS